MDSTGDAVLHLNVELRKGVVYMVKKRGRPHTGNDRSFLDISLGGTIDKISDVESLDGLILMEDEHERNGRRYLANTTVAVGATDSLDMATAFLGTTSVSIVEKKSEHYSKRVGLLRTIRQCTERG